MKTKQNKKFLGRMKINERIYLALKLTMIFKHKKEKEKEIMR
jgi:hypothetical protein